MTVSDHASTEIARWHGVDRVVVLGCDAGGGL